MREMRRVGRVVVAGDWLALVVVVNYFTAAHSSRDKPYPVNCGGCLDEWWCQCFEPVALKFGVSIPTAAITSATP